MVQLAKDFPDDEACLEFIFDALHSKECSCGGTYARLAKRRQYQCSRCRFQIAPTAGTIFHKSDTPLVLWFHAIHVFSNAKSGISAKQMERELEVTYKTAWRMMRLIRKALRQDDAKLDGEVEADGAYFGGKKTVGKKEGARSRAMLDKPLAMAAVERGGRMKAEVVAGTGVGATVGFIEKNVEKGARLLTDSSPSYVRLGKTYRRDAVNHGKEYVRGDVHVNNIETFWSHVKRSIRGTHKSISKEHFQSYLDGFVFHYNNRHSDRRRFSCLLGTLLRA